MKKTVSGLALIAFFLLIPGQLKAEAEAVKLTGSFGVYNPPPLPPIPPNPPFPLPKRHKIKVNKTLQIPFDGFIVIEPPIFEADVILSGGEKIEFRIPTGLFTDLLFKVEEEVMRPGEIVPLPLRTETHLGFVSEDNGSFFLEDYTEELISKLGVGTEYFLPNLENFETGGELNIFIGVDLNQWLTSTPQFEIGDTFDFVNGLSNELPGFIAGTSPIQFSPTQGWFTEQPFTGSLTTTGTIDGDSMPVPESSSTSYLLFFGLGGLALTLKRKLKSSKSPRKETTKVG